MGRTLKTALATLVILTALLSALISCSGEDQPYASISDPAPTQSTETKTSSSAGAPASGTGETADNPSAYVKPTQDTGYLDPIQGGTPSVAFPTESEVLPGTPTAIDEPSVTPEQPTPTMPPITPTPTVTPVTPTPTETPVTPTPTETPVTPTLTETPVTPTPTETPVTPTPTETPVTPTPTETPVTPTPTETPVTPTPTETPVTPTPTETPRAPLSMRGSAISQTGKAINVYFDYLITEDERGDFTVRVEAYLDHYSLYCGKRTSGNNITIGDEVYPYSTPGYNFDMDQGKQHTPLSEAERVYTPETLPPELTLSACWLFNGTYSGQPIGLIQAETTVDLSEYARPAVSAPTTRETL